MGRGTATARKRLSSAEAHEAYLEVLRQYQDELGNYTVRREGVDAATAQRELNTLRQRYQELQQAWREINPIRLARRAQGYSVQALAARARVSHPTIQTWENGAVQFPGITKMKQLAEALGESNLREQWEHWHGLLRDIPLVPTV